MVSSALSIPEMVLMGGGPISRLLPAKLLLPVIDEGMHRTVERVMAEKALDVSGHGGAVFGGGRLMPARKASNSFAGTDFV